MAHSVAVRGGTNFVRLPHSVKVDFYRSAPSNFQASEHCLDTVLRQ